MKYLGPAVLCLLLAACGRVQKLEAGKYQVADQEYSGQNYVMERTFGPDGALEERHTVDMCLLMEMTGGWEQRGGDLTVHYRRLRNRASCRDTLPAWSPDSAKLEIPIRNVDKASFESFLAASDGKPEKWIKWIRLD